MTIKLSAKALDRLPPTIERPRYSRGDLKPGIVHIGLGNFHRAHQAVFLNDLFNLGLDLDWAIVGAGVRAADETVRLKLKEQDYLTTVVEQEAAATNVRVTGSMIDFISPSDTGAALAIMSKPEIRIVSLTITEGGYYISPATQKFDPSHPDMVRDAKSIETPQTALGLIVAALGRRREANTAPFTVMCCDNIPGNGRVTRGAIAGLAELVDPALAAWIRKEVAFPNSMVDRITPVTTDRERGLLRDLYGVDDHWPVFCEEYRQWVMEDHFPSGRPAFEKVGVTFTHAVEPYELMKIRILNGGHAAIAYPAGLLDIHFVHEAMEDPQIRAFLEKLTRDEIMPTLSPPPQTDLEVYRRQIERRFANPKIGDTITRLCFDGSNRQPKFILPTASSRLQAGGGVAGLALVSALWCRYAYGESESGEVIPPNDSGWERIQQAARAARADPRAFLTLHDIFGAVADEPAYVAAFSGALASLWSLGVRATLAAYLSGKQ